MPEIIALGSEVDADVNLPTRRGFVACKHLDDFVGKVGCRGAADFQNALYRAQLDASHLARRVALRQQLRARMPSQPQPSPKCPGAP